MKIEITATVFLTVDLDGLRIDDNETTEQLIEDAEQIIKSLIRNGGFNCTTDRWVTVDDIEVETEAEARALARQES